MHEFNDSRRLECHGKEIHHLISDGIRIELHAYRMLHPRVGNKNPPSRYHSADSRKPSSHKVCAFTHFLPSEEHDSDKGSLHKESEDAFYSKRSTKNVAYKPRIIREIRAKLKFQNYAGSHTYGKIDAEEFLPKAGYASPRFIATHHIDGFHDGHHYTQSEGEGYKQPMIAGCKRKLNTREEY